MQAKSEQLTPNIDKEPFQQEPTLTEDLSQRNSNGRVWGITKWQKEINPQTNESNNVCIKSYIREVGCGICYKDSNDNWQVTDTSWKQTENGFVMDKAGYSLKIGKTANALLYYDLEGDILTLKADSIKIYDGQNISSFASINETKGFIDPNNKTILIYPNAFGNSIDLEIQAQPGGFHQNVIFRNKFNLPAGIQKEKAKIFLYTQLGLEEYLRNSQSNGSVVKLSRDQKNITAASLDISQFSKSNIDFVVEKEGMKTVTRHSFANSEIMQNSKMGKLKKWTVADKQIIRDIENKTYLVESLDYSKMNEAIYPVVWDYQTVSGPINAPTAWYADATYYVSQDIILGSGIELKIEPGTIIKFNTGKKIDASNGKLTAKGNPYEYIIFTSKYDSTMGDNISTGTPTKSDWNGLYLSGTSKIDFCKIAYMENGINCQLSGNVYCEVANSIIQNCYYYMVNVTDTSNVTGGTLQIKNNLMNNSSSCETGIGIGLSTDPIDNLVCGISNNTIVNMELNGIFAHPNDETWQAMIIRNNLICSCGEGINANQSFDYTINHNGYYNIQYLYSWPDDKTCSVSPFDTTNTYLGSHYLNSVTNGGALLQNAGYGNVTDYYDVPNNWSVRAVSDADHLYTTATTLSADATWCPNYSICDTCVVDIGYHHPRVDYLLRADVTVPSGKTLKIVPGTIVTMGGGGPYNSGTIYVSGKIIAQGEPFDRGYIHFIHYASASANWDTVYNYGGTTYPYIYLQNTSDAGSMVNFLKINNLRGLRICKVLSHPVHDNIFKFNYYALSINTSDGDLEIINNLFVNNYCGLTKGGSQPSLVKNNNFRGNTYGLQIFTSNANIQNNIITDSSYGIWLQSGVGNITEAYNAFFNNTHHYGNGLLLASTDFAGQPTANYAAPITSADFLTIQNWSDFTDGFYLPQNSDLVDGGNSADGPMCGYTTNPVNSTIDNNRRDIGYHYPTTSYENFWLGNCSQPPVAKLSIIPNNPVPNNNHLTAYVIANKQVLLDGSYSQANGSSTIIKYQWDFDGDGKYDYAEGGVVHPDGTADGRTWRSFDSTCSVSLMVTDSAGNSDKVTINVIVNADSENSIQGDGLPDAWETLYQVSEPSSDDDSDGYNNLCEYMHGSIPKGTGASASTPAAGVIVAHGGATPIQNAIDASIANDTIIVLPGTYVESINFSKPDRTLRSIDPDNWEIVAKTIIHDESSYDEDISIGSPADTDTILEGFTIKGPHSFDWNGTWNGGVGLYIDGVSPVIRKCIITQYGDSIMLSDSSANIKNCFIVRNADGVWNWGDIPTIDSCVFSNNNCGITNMDGSMELRNCTIIKNYNWGIWNEGVVSIYNTILWGNDTAIENYGDTYTYICHVQGVQQDSPEFAYIENPAGPDGLYGTRDDGLTLKTNSPCIDTGNNAYVTSSEDITGKTRVIDGDHTGSPTAIVDKGAYELNKIWYVKTNGSATNNGSSWTTAKTLTSALSSASTGDEIWVAAGTYKPGSLRSDSFQLIEGVSIYGRFEGTETDFTDREAANQTILSGDIDTSGDNDSFHIVKGGVNSVLDSFIIRNGRADYAGSSESDGLGGGIYSDEAMTVRNCFIEDNYADRGGGIYVSPKCDSIQVSNCVLSGNDAASGGAVSNAGNLSEFVNCTIAENTADGPGAGLINTDMLVIENSIVWDNLICTTPSSLYNSAVNNKAFIFSSDVQGCIDDVTEQWVPSFGNNCGGNIDDDPDFDSLSSSGLELVETSPCINAGDNSIVYEAWDIRDWIRKWDGHYNDNFIVDIGTYECRGHCTWLRQVHFSGVLTGDGGGSYSHAGLSVAFEDDGASDILEPTLPPYYGYYPDAWEVLTDTNPSSLDGIAIHEGTRIRIWSGTNYTGDLVLNVCGPAIIINAMWIDDSRYAPIMAADFSATGHRTLQAEFPPSVRYWSNDPRIHPEGEELMHNDPYCYGTKELAIWGKGSIIIDAAP